MRPINLNTLWAIATVFAVPLTSALGQSTHPRTAAPAAVLADLQAHKCVSSGVISGHFTSAKSTDWAGTCVSTEGYTDVRVYPGGAVSAVETMTISGMPNGHYKLSVLSPAKVGRAAGGAGEGWKRPLHQGIYAKSSGSDKQEATIYCDSGSCQGFGEAL